MTSVDASGVLGEWHVAAAPVAVGILAGLIFLLDGWRSSPNDELDQSRKLRALLYVLGGSGIVSLIAADAPVLNQARFIFWATATVLAGLTAGGAAVFIYANARLRHHHPARAPVDRLLHSIPFVADALVRGISFLQSDLDTRAYNVFDTPNERAIDLGLALMREVEPATSAESVELILQRWLERLLRDVLQERQSQPQTHRAYIYMLSPEDDVFHLLCGVSPRGHAEGHGPLQLRSVAGAAVLNPGIPVGVELDGNRARRTFPESVEIDFDPTNQTDVCRTIVACSGAMNLDPADCQVVLAVDFYDQAAKEPPQDVQAVLFFAAKMIRLSIVASKVKLCDVASHAATRADDLRVSY